jgi:GDSL-like Lipase/Acylhydrolase family
VANYRLRIGATPGPSSNRVALVGDSLTDDIPNRNWSPFWWVNGLAAKGGQKLVANCGINGETVGQMLARINNSYTSGSPGLAGLAPLGTVYIRAGTNDARALTAIASLSATYTSLLNAIKSYCEEVIILSVPPMGSTEPNFAAKNALGIEYNTWLENFASLNQAGFVYVNDNINTRNLDGTIVASYFSSDGVHNIGRGTWRQGVDGAAALNARYASYGYSSPLVLSPTDVYPATQQLVPNHLMVGTSGTVGIGFTGTAANNWTVQANGSSITGTCSKVAADVGDPNQTAWQRITPTQVATSGTDQSIRLSSALAVSPAAATSNPIEVIYEVRFNSFNTNYFSLIRATLPTTTLQLILPVELKFGGEVLNDTLTVRMALDRVQSGALVSPQIHIDLIISANFTGAMGSIDFRNITARQE